MFYTKLWDKTGITILQGPPGVEKHAIIDHVIREAREMGLSTKKSFHHLNRHVNWCDTQVVSFYNYNDINEITI